MKRILAILAVCGLVGGAAMALNIPTPPVGTGQAQGKLVVHEWGTFTGFAGSDGVHLPFGTTAGNDLPAFVVTRREQAQRLHPEINPFQFVDWGKGGGVFALQRMETPVIYFYTGQPRDVSVAVNFPQGLLTEFYPPVRGMTPVFGEAPGEPRIAPEGAKPTTQPAPKLARPERGSLDWGTVRITPQSAGGLGNLPEVPHTPETAAAEHYEYARETDAATVTFSDRPGETHHERFLFYRGLGDFTLPVTLSASGENQFELSNKGEQPIRFAMLLHIEDGHARFAVHGDVAGRKAMTLPTEKIRLEDVDEKIVIALVAEGLYEKEARAMVKTWRSNWLGEPGTRVLYTVPRAVTDGLLPLRISPMPDETVRVLVGRIDVMTPQQESRIQSMLATSVTTKSLAAEDTAFLKGLGRFVIPALERSATLSGASRREINALRSHYYDAVRNPQVGLK